MTRAVLSLGASALIALSAPSSADETIGRSLYDQHCATCHQADGSGVSFLQPGLIGSARANGPVGETIEMILFGSAAVPPRTREYGNEMPGLRELSDEDVAQIATYVRTHFTNSGGPVTVDDVRTVRSRGPAIP